VVAICPPARTLTVVLDAFAAADASSPPALSAATSDVDGAPLAATDGTNRRRTRRQ
jgi:hypothetical protein